MKKSAVRQQILNRLAAELELYAKAARAAHAEATHEQSKAENKYDTRGLEASYLARGQSRQAAEVELAHEQFAQMVLRDFGPEDPVDVGALVELDGAGERAWYFVGPRAGGTEVTVQRREITVITPSSPLGRQLQGRRQGETVRLEGDGRPREFRILSVV